MLVIGENLDRWREDERTLCVCSITRAKSWIQELAQLVQKLMKRSGSPE